MYVFLFIIQDRPHLRHVATSCQPKKPVGSYEQKRRNDRGKEAQWSEEHLRSAEVDVYKKKDLHTMQQIVDSKVPCAGRYVSEIQRGFVPLYPGFLSLSSLYLSLSFAFALFRSPSPSNHRRVASSIVNKIRVYIALLYFASRGPGFLCTSFFYRYATPLDRNDVFLIGVDL